MQASCSESINDSFEILRPVNFVHVVHQIGGVLYNPPSTEHGGSASSTLVMPVNIIIYLFIIYLFIYLSNRSMA